MLLFAMPYPPFAPGTPIAFIGSKDIQTSGTNQLLDASYFGGTTPLGGMLFTTANGESAQPNASNVAAFSFGNLNANFSFDRFLVNSNHGTASTEVRRSGGINSTDNVIQNNPPGVYSARVQRIANGVSIENTVSLPPGGKIDVLCLHPTHCLNYDSNHIDLGTGTSPISVTLGWRPDFILFFTNCSNLASASSFFNISAGAIIDDGSNKQRALSIMEGDAQSAGRPFSTLSSAYSGLQITSPAGGISWGLTAAITDTGFTVTPSASTGSDAIIYVAVKTNGRQVALVDFDTPTSTGTTDIDCGFRPSLGFSLNSGLTLLNDYASATSEPQSHFGLSMFTATQARALSLFLQSGADPTNTKSNQKALAYTLGYPSGPLDIRATLQEFYATGARLNFTHVDATARKGAMLLVS